MSGDTPFSIPGKKKELNCLPHSTINCIFAAVNFKTQATYAKKMKKLFILMIGMMALLSGKASAENLENIPTQFINSEMGLGGETVPEIISDRFGQKWVATNNGVNCYNGAKMTTIPVPDNQPGRNYVYDICAGEDDCIYIATEKGIFKLAPNENMFSRILPDINKAETILEAKGKLYIGNREGLLVSDGKTVVKTIHAVASPISIENGVRDIQEDSKGNIWFTSRYAINCYSPKTGKFTSTKLSAHLPDAAALSHLAILNSNKIYIGTKNNGLYAYSPRDKQMKYIKGIGNIINSLHLTKRGELTVGTDGSGAYLLATGNDEIIASYGTNGKGKYYLPTDVVYCYYRDDAGIDWFGFYRYGMAHTFKNEKLFNTYQYGGFTTEGMNVRSFYIHGSTYLMGTFHGLILVDEKRNLVKQFSPAELDGIHIISNIIYYNGYYYIGSYDNGLRRINAQNFSVGKITSQPILATITISSLVISPDNKLWIGTSEGLFIMDEKGDFKHYTENNSSLIGAGLNTIFFDSRHNGWIGGAQGLCYYAANAKVFENSFPKDFFNKEHINEISPAKKGKMFFTARSGIYYSDETMQSFGQLDLPPFLAKKTCSSFIDDQKGNYWLLTENGLFRMNYDTQELMSFGYGEGLDCRIINGRLFIDKEGKIWLGTSNGLKSLNLGKLTAWQKKNDSKVLLYDIMADGASLSFAQEQTINHKREIPLSWNFTSSPIMMKVVLNDFARPAGRLFEYKIDGEQEWHVIHAEDPLQLSGLLLGSHQLEIRLSGAPSTMAVYDISVTPSAMAYFELVLLVIPIILYILWVRYHKYTKTLLQERDDMEKALIEMENEQQNTAAAAEIEKYRGIKVNESEYKDIVKRMKKYLEETKRYTEQDMKMSDVADYLHVSSSKLSMVFNLYLHENYYEFINRYRLEEFKRLIAEGAADKYTIIALSEKCGFKKSNFFSTFRKIEGMTPTEYLKKNNIVMKK